MGGTNIKSSPMKYYVWILAYDTLLGPMTFKEAMKKYRFYTEEPKNFCEILKTASMCRGMWWVNGAT